MEQEDKYRDRIDEYLAGKLSKEERIAFEAELKGNASLRAELELQGFIRNQVVSLSTEQDASGSIDEANEISASVAAFLLAKKADSIRGESNSTEEIVSSRKTVPPSEATSRLSLRQVRGLWSGGIAATFILLFVFLAPYFSRPSPEGIYAEGFNPAEIQSVNLLATLSDSVCQLCEIERSANSETAIAGAQIDSILREKRLPLDFLSQLKQGEEAYQLKRFGDAAQIWQRLLEQPLDSTQHRRLIIRLAYYAGISWGKAEDWDAAVQYYEQCLTYGLRDAGGGEQQILRNAEFYLALTYLRKEGIDSTKAKELFEKISTDAESMHREKAVWILNSL